jgi:hypothetical protein
LLLQATRGARTTINRYAHPSRFDIVGPKPDPCVWIGLFLGKCEEDETRGALEKKAAIRQQEGEIPYGGVYKKLKQKVPNNGQQGDREYPAVSMLLTWAILSNRPEMVKCLVLQGGVQFRWITHDSFAGSRTI